MIVFVDPFDAFVEDSRIEIKDLVGTGIEHGTPGSQSDTHPLRQSRHIIILSQSVLNNRLWDLEIFPKIRTSLPIRFLPPIINTTQMKI
jgi:hypothetical protein